MHSASASLEGTFWPRWSRSSLRTLPESALRSYSNQATSTCLRCSGVDWKRRPRRIHWSTDPAAGWAGALSR
ncbi:hypothetical protein ACRRTK_016306 [Alexandromys fortis]